MKYAFTILLAVVLFIEKGIGNPVEKCCAAKTVGDIAYSLVGEGQVPARSGCLNGCIYRRDSDLAGGQKFCFASGQLLVECIQTIPTGPGPVVWTTAAPSGPTGTPAPPSAVLLTGGWKSVSPEIVLSSVEVYGTSACSPTSYSLPEPRRGPATFVTRLSQVATCGGARFPGDSSYRRDCLVLTLGSGWERGVLGNLTTERYLPAVTSLDAGVFMVGGTGGKGARKSMDVLLTGSSQWQKGPKVPIDMGEGCAVSISPWQMIVLRDHNVREFNSKIDGALSGKGWQPATRWPNLLGRRVGAGCAVINGQLVVAGGDSAKTTEIINIAQRTRAPGPELLVHREYFHLAVLPAPGGDLVLAIGGNSGSSSGFKSLDSVEEWLPSSTGWANATRLLETRFSFGAVAIPEGLVCP